MPPVSSRVTTMAVAQSHHSRISIRRRPCRVPSFAPSRPAAFDRSGFGTFSFGADFVMLVFPLVSFIGLGAQAPRNRENSGKNPQNRDGNPQFPLGIFSLTLVRTGQTHPHR